MLKKYFALFFTCILVLHYKLMPNHEKKIRRYKPSVDMKSSNSVSPCFIYKKPSGGRLGNMLYEYASSYGISTWNNCTLVIKSSNPLLRYFPNLLAKVKDENHDVFQNFAKEYAEKPLTARVFNEHLMEFPRASKIKISGYLGNWKYFKHEIENIKNQYIFSDEIKKNALRYILQSKQRNNSKTAVAIHVRRGDRTKNHNIAFGFVVAPLSYYILAMEFYRKLYSNTVFIVCSDSIDWCKTNLAFNDVIVRTGTSPIEDFAVLSLCDHTIISVGTFGWWGALLSSGHVVAYEKQYNSNKQLAKAFSGISNEEIFYPGWTVINDTEVVIIGDIG